MWKLKSAIRYLGGLAVLLMSLGLHSAAAAQTSWTAPGPGGPYPSYYQAPYGSLGGILTVTRMLFMSGRCLTPSTM
jgi:hypothetical protein